MKLRENIKNLKYFFLIFRWEKLPTVVLFPNFILAITSQITEKYYAKMPDDKHEWVNAGRRNPSRSFPFSLNSHLAGIVFTILPFVWHVPTTLLVLRFILNDRSVWCERCVWKGVLESAHFVQNPLTLTQSNCKYTFENFAHPMRLCTVYVGTIIVSTYSNQLCRPNTLVQK